MIHPKTLFNYFGIAFSYGFIRKMIYVKDIKQYEDHKKTPLLYTDRLLLSTYGGFASMYMFPFYLLVDIRNIEILSRKDVKIIPYEYTDYGSLFLSVHAYETTSKEK